MGSIISEIREALANRLFYAAIMLCLAIPDICAALESDDGMTKEDGYKKWYRTWFQPRYPNLNEDNIYSLRNGVFHRGQLLAPRKETGLYDRIVFTLPSNSERIDDRVQDGVYFTDAWRFCMQMIFSANDWYNANQDQPNVKKNIERLVQYRQWGLVPYIRGVGVVA